MIPFVLLLATALLAGWQVFHGALWASLGSSPNCLPGVFGVVGVVVLSVAAYATVWSRSIGFKFALVGLVAIGIALAGSWPVWFSPLGHRAIWFAYMPPLLVVVTTVYVLIGLVRPGSTVLYPAAASGRTKSWMVALTAGLVIVAAGWCLGQ